MPHPAAAPHQADPPLLLWLPSDRVQGALRQPVRMYPHISLSGSAWLQQARPLSNDTWTLPRGAGPFQTPVAACIQGVDMQMKDCSRSTADKVTVICFAACATALHCSCCQCPHKEHSLT